MSNKSPDEPFAVATRGLVTFWRQHRKLPNSNGTESVSACVQCGVSTCERCGAIKIIVCKILFGSSIRILHFTKRWFGRTSLVDMSKSRLTQTLAAITKKMKWPDNKSVGYHGPDRHDKYVNPLLTPPPRSPSTPEDFRNPERLGHWVPYGEDYTNPIADKYYMHETMASMIFAFIVGMWLWSYAPDYKLHEWSKREAYLRTHKREALGLPLIDRNVVDPERITLPTEEELGNFHVTL